MSDIIPESFYQRLYGTSQGSLLWEADDYGYGGYCYGMSSSVGSIVHYNNPSVSTYRYGTTFATCLNSIGVGWTSGANGLSAKDYIRYSQISQYDSRIGAEKSKNWESYAALVAAVRSSIRGETPIVIGIYGRNGGHAIFPVAISSDTASRTVVLVYDCNYPQKDLELTLYKSSGSYNGYFDYPYGGFAYLDFSTPSDEMDRMFAGGNTTVNIGGLSSVLTNAQEKYTLYRVPEGTLATVGGTTYELSSTMKGDHNVFPVRDAGNSQDSSLYWVRAQAGVVTFRDVEENTTIAAASETGGVEVTVGANAEVAVSVADGRENAVTIDTSAGSTYEVCYKEDTGDNVLDELTVSGVTDGGELRTWQSGGTVEVEGARTVGREVA